MLDEHKGDIVADLDGSWRLLCGKGPELPLPGAVVDEVLNPLGMLSEDGPPEEFLVRSPAAGPLLWEPLTDTGQLGCVFPDLVHGQLRPYGDLDGVGDVALKLHDLDTLKHLLDESKRTVILSWEEHSLQTLFVKTTKVLTVLFTK